MVQLPITDQQQLAACTGDGTGGRSSTAREQWAAMGEMPEVRGEGGGGSQLYKCREINCDRL